MTSNGEKMLCGVIVCKKVALLWRKLYLSEDNCTCEENEAWYSKSSGGGAFYKNYRKNSTYL